MIMSLSWFEPMSAELHQTGTFEGCSTDWATAPRKGLVIDQRQLNIQAFDYGKRKN